MDDEYMGIYTVGFCVHPGDLITVVVRNSKFYCSILLRLHRSFKVSIGLDEASCPEAGGSRPGCTSALSAQRGSNPGKK